MKKYSTQRKLKNKQIDEQKIKEEKIINNFSSIGRSIDPKKFEQKLEQFKKNLSQTEPSDKVTLENNTTLDLVALIYQGIRTWKIKNGIVQNDYLAYDNRDNRYLQQMMYSSDTLPENLLLSLQKIFPSEHHPNVSPDASINLFIPIKKIPEENDAQQSKLLLQLMVGCYATASNQEDKDIQKLTWLTAQVLYRTIEESPLRWYPIKAYSKGFFNALHTQKEYMLDDNNSTISENVINKTHALFNAIFDTLNSEKYVTKESHILQSLKNIFSHISTISSKPDRDNKYIFAVTDFKLLHHDHSLNNFFIPKSSQR